MHCASTLLRLVVCGMVVTLGGVAWLPAPADARQTSPVHIGYREVHATPEQKKALKALCSSDAARRALSAAFTKGDCPGAVARARLFLYGNRFDAGGLARLGAAPPVARVSATEALAAPWPWLTALLADVRNTGLSVQFAAEPITKLFPDSYVAFARVGDLTLVEFQGWEAIRPGAVRTLDGLATDVSTFLASDTQIGSFLAGSGRLAWLGQKRAVQPGGYQATAVRYFSDGSDLFAVFEMRALKRPGFLSVVHCRLATDCLNQSEMRLALGKSDGGVERLRNQ